MFPESSNPNQGEPKKNLKIVLAFVVLIALGIGGYFGLKKTGSPTAESVNMPTSTTTNNLTRSEVPYNGEWGRVSDLPGKISFDYPKFGKDLDVHVEVERVSENIIIFRLIKIIDIESENKPTVYYRQNEYSINIIDNLKKLSSDQWLAENYCPELIKNPEIYTLTKLQNNVQILDITGQLPDSVLDNCGPLPHLLWATTPSGDKIISIVTAQEGYSLFEGLTDGYGLRKVFYSVLGSLSEGLNESLITYDIPVSWTLIPPEDGYGATLYTREAMDEIRMGSENTPPSLSIGVVENTNKLNLSDFIKTYFDGWFTFYYEQRDSTVDGYPAISISDTKAEVPHNPIRATVVQVENKMIIITAEQSVGDREFEDFIKTVKIHKSQ